MNPVINRRQALLGMLGAGGAAAAMGSTPAGAKSIRHIR